MSSTPSHILDQTASEDHADSSKKQPSRSENNEEEKAPLALPEPEEATPAAHSWKLDMSNGGDTLKLDELGPLVINTDGSMSRINNWAQMTADEQERTKRLISKRNKQRLDALRQA